MALTVGEAIDVDVLARYVLGLEGLEGTADQCQADSAKRALVALATKANRRLHAGIRPEDVERQWDARPTERAIAELKGGGSLAVLVVAILRGEK